MRASTLFALTIAVLVGLGVAIAGKMTGLFGTPPPEPTPTKKQDIMVLVAAKNLFAGDMIDPTGVKARALKPEEITHYQQNKGKYLPPVTQAAVLRVANKNILADQPILFDNLEALTKPKPLNERLLPQMRAINISLMKEESAGGMITVGDWVDVLLTSSVEGKHIAPSTQTACIIPHVRVVAKRNTLWPVFAPLPDGKPIHYTLEVNPYRAALLEFVRNRGELALAPIPATEQRQLEALRQSLLQRDDGVKQVHFAPPGSPESDEEDARVAAFNRGDLVVNERDLVRIFNLKTEPPPVAPFSIERLGGIYRYSPAVFSGPGAVVPDGPPPMRAGAAPRPSTAPQAAYNFSCPSCGKQNNQKRSPSR